MSNCTNVIHFEFADKPCGLEDRYGHVIYCPSCERRLARAFPQGWRNYPGDTCPHGKYTGGSGRDLMCGACEMGDDPRSRQSQPGANAQRHTWRR